MFRGLRHLWVLREDISYPRALAKDTKRDRLPEAERPGGKLWTPPSREGRQALGYCSSTSLLQDRETDSVSLAQSYRTTLPIHA